MRKPGRKNFVKREETEQHRINEKITARQVRLVMDGEEPKVLSVYDARKIAEEQDLDLVEIYRKNSNQKVKDFAQKAYEAILSG